MKHLIRILVAGFAILAVAPVAHAEELQDFIKRTGTGHGTTNDVHENFHLSVFVDGQTFEMDHDKILKFWEQQRASGIKLTVNEFTILSQTETPNNGGTGSVISVVTKIKVTEDVRGTLHKIESTSHFIIVRDPNGVFRLLYLAIPKQVRDP